MPDCVAESLSCGTITMNKCVLFHFHFYAVTQWYVV